MSRCRRRMKRTSGPCRRRSEGHHAAQLRVVEREQALHHDHRGRPDGAGLARNGVDPKKSYTGISIAWPCAARPHGGHQRPVEGVGMVVVLLAPVRRRHGGTGRGSSRPASPRPPAPEPIAASTWRVTVDLPLPAAGDTDDEGLVGSDVGMGGPGSGTRRFSQARAAARRQPAPTDGRVRTALRCSPASSEALPPAAVVLTVTVCSAQKRSRYSGPPAFGPVPTGLRRRRAARRPPRRSGCG